MKKKFNEELLNEELKRFKLLQEYDFYVGEDEDSSADDVILGEEGEEDLPPDDSQTATSGGTETQGSELGIDDLDDNPDDMNMDDPTMGDADQSTPEMEPIDDMSMDDGSELDGMDTGDDEVELDVTELVTGTEEAKESADMANQKLDGMMSMLGNLESRLNSMDSITAKIDSLENELEKRVPTPEEKIEMRSLDSYPYNLKLTDFWAEKQGQYDVMGVNDKEAEPTEYTLTQDDVESDYNEASIKNSLKDTNEFEEEDIY